MDVLSTVLWVNSAMNIILYIITSDQLCFTMIFFISPLLIIIQFTNHQIRLSICSFIKYRLSFHATLMIAIMLLESSISHCFQLSQNLKICNEKGTDWKCYCKFPIKCLSSCNKIVQFIVHIKNQFSSMKSMWDVRFLNKKLVKEILSLW